jgi:hypothetical protein
MIGKYSIVKLTFLPALFIAVYTNFTQAQDLGSIKNQTAFSISGTLGASFNIYSAENRPASAEDLSWLFNGAPVISIYGIALPFSFTYSEQQRDFRQPFNKIGVSPYYKWAKLNLGWRTIGYSAFTSSGYNWLGSGLELNPGKFRFAYFRGRLNKAIEEDTLNTKKIFQTPAYQRSGFTAKVGYGSKDNYLDLVLFKAEDDSSSIHRPSRSNVTPGKNAVIALNSYQKLNKNFIFSLDLSQSFYTRDAGAIKNDSAIVPEKVSGIPSFLMSPDETTRKGTALNTSLAYVKGGNGVAVQYKRISPDFYSMGVYYLIPDLREITLKPSATFFKDRLQTQLSIGIQSDNLDDSKPVTTNRTIGSLSLTARPIDVYTINLTYSNYDIGQKQAQVSPDSIFSVSQTTHNLMLMQMLNLIRKSTSHTISLILNNQKLNDRNQLSDAGYSVFIVSGNYQFGLINSGLNAGIGYLNSRFDDQLTVLTSAGPDFSVSKMFLRNKIQTGFNLSLLNNKIGGSKAGTVNIISANFNYRPDKHHRFSLRFNKQNVSIENTAPSSNSETKTILSYAYTF